MFVPFTSLVTSRWQKLYQLTISGRHVYNFVAGMVIVGDSFYVDVLWFVNISTEAENVL